MKTPIVLFVNFANIQFSKNGCNLINSLLKNTSKLDLNKNFARNVASFIIKRSKTWKLAKTTVDSVDRTLPEAVGGSFEAHTKNFSNLGVFDENQGKTASCERAGKHITRRP